MCEGEPDRHELEAVRQRALHQHLDDARSRDADAQRRDEEADRRDRDASLAAFLDPDRSDFEEVARRRHLAALDRESARDDRARSARDRTG